MRRRPTLTALFAVALVVSLEPVARAAKPPADAAVVATLADAAQGSWLRVGSDGLGAYLPTQLQSIIQPRATGSDWLLTTYAVKRGKLTWTRGARIDLSEQETDGGFPTPIAGPMVLPVHLKVGCSGVNVDMLRLVPGQAASCPGSFRFLAPNGRWYRLAFNADNYPEVDQVTVGCEMTDAAGCKVWTLGPGGPPTLSDANPKNRTRLLEIDDSGNVLAVGNTYFVSFGITLTR